MSGLSDRLSELEDIEQVWDLFGTQMGFFITMDIEVTCDHRYATESVAVVKQINKFWQKQVLTLFVMLGGGLYKDIRWTSLSDNESLAFANSINECTQGRSALNVRWLTRDVLNITIWLNAFWHRTWSRGHTLYSDRHCPVHVRNYPWAQDRPRGCAYGTARSAHGRVGLLESGRHQ